MYLKITQICVTLLPYASKFFSICLVFLVCFLLIFTVYRFSEAFNRGQLSLFSIWTQLLLDNAGVTIGALLMQYLKRYENQCDYHAVHIHIKGLEKLHFTEADLQHYIKIMQDYKLLHHRGGFYYLNPRLWLMTEAVSDELDTRNFACIFEQHNHRPPHNPKELQEFMNMEEKMKHEVYPTINVETMLRQKKQSWSMKECLAWSIQYQPDMLKSYLCIPEEINEEQIKAWLQGKTIDTLLKPPAIPYKGKLPTGCFRCQEKSAAWSCSICGASHYCSQTCQGLSWNHHKIACKKKDYDKVLIRQFEQMVLDTARYEVTSQEIEAYRNVVGEEKISRQDQAISFPKDLRDCILYEEFKTLFSGLLPQMQTLFQQAMQDRAERNKARPPCSMETSLKVFEIPSDGEMSLEDLPAYDRENNCVWHVHNNQLCRAPLETERIYTSMNEHFIPFEHQKEAVSKIFRYPSHSLLQHMSQVAGQPLQRTLLMRRGVVEIPCGGGKTALLLATAIGSQSRVLIFVWNTQLGEQLLQEVISHTDIPRDRICLLSNDGEEWSSESKSPWIVVVTYSKALSLHRNHKNHEIFHKDWIILVDEVHHMFGDMMRLLMLLYSKYLWPQGFFEKIKETSKTQCGAFATCDQEVVTQCDTCHTIYCLQHAEEFIVNGKRCMTCVEDKREKQRQFIRRKNKKKKRKTHNITGDKRIRQHLDRLGQRFLPISPVLSPLPILSPTFSLASSSSSPSPPPIIMAPPTPTTLKPVPIRHPHGHALGFTGSFISENEEAMQEGSYFLRGKRDSKDTVIYRADMMRLRRQGIIMQNDVYCYVVAPHPQVKNVRYNPNKFHMASLLVQYLLQQDSSRRILCLCTETHMWELMAEELKVPVFHGSIHHDEKRALVKHLDQGTYRCLVSSYAIAEGFNFR